MGKLFSTEDSANVQDALFFWCFMSIPSIPTPTFEIHDIFGDLMSRDGLWGACMGTIRLGQAVLWSNVLSMVKSNIVSP